MELLLINIISIVFAVIIEFFVFMFALKHFFTINSDRFGFLTDSDFYDTYAVEGDINDVK